MDLSPLLSLLAAVPYGPQIVAFGPALVTLAAVFCSIVPPPATTSAFYPAYAVVNFIALNFGQAKNANAPATFSRNAISDPSIVSAITKAALVFTLGASMLLSACSASQVSAVTSGVNTVVADGQLFCATATATGPIVVALANAAGAPVTVTGQASADVAAACAVIKGIPVVPPANPAAAPVVAANVALAAVK